MLEGSSERSMGVFLLPHKPDQVGPRTTHGPQLCRPEHRDIPDGRGVAEPMLRLKFYRLARAWWVTFLKQFQRSLTDVIRDRTMTWDRKLGMRKGTLHPPHCMRPSI